jgi:hypothetical protein
MELQAFNNSLKIMFVNKPDEDLQYIRCRKAIGCAYTIEEMKVVGK